MAAHKSGDFQMQVVMFFWCQIDEIEATIATFESRLDEIERSLRVGDLDAASRYDVWFSPPNSSSSSIMICILASIPAIPVVVVVGNWMY